MTLRLITPLVAVLAVFGSWGCGGCGGDDAGTDAGDQRNYSLTVLDPPGDSIGLAFGERVTMSVLYADPDGDPVANHQIAFAMLTSASEDPGGSTLSANSALTDSLGIAHVDLVAGAERTNFRVEANAADAPTARFYIAVSEDGFADIQVTPTHLGWRLAEDFDRVELRLFTGAELRCVDLDIDAAPTSVFSPRSLAGFAGNVTFQNVSAGAPYTIIAWAEVAGSDSRVSSGCIDLGGQQVPASPIKLELVVSDRALDLPATMRLESTIDLAPVAAAIEPAAAPWAQLACAEVGAGQLILDCTLDALAADDELDCVVTSSAAIVATIDARRGVPSAGCRPAHVATDPTLDLLLTDAVVAGDDFPTGAELATIIAIRADALTGFSLISALGFYGPSSAHHALHSLTLHMDGEERTVDLRASDRPVLEQTEIAVVHDPAGELDIGSHGFTLRYGSVAAALFRTLALEPSGLGDRDRDLAAALFASVYDETSDSSGCAAVSAIICAEIEAAADCAVAACSAAIPVADALLTSWWRQLDGPGHDLVLDGSAPLYDFDDDLAIDTIGVDDSEARTGSWSAHFTLADDSAVEASGVFGSIGPAEPAQ